MKNLPAELISLIHYVELSDAGWWEKTKERCLLSIMWGLKKPVQINQIQVEIRKQMGVNLKRGEISSCLGLLESKDKVISMPNNYFKISESSYEELTRDLEAASELEERVRSRFFDRVKSITNNIDPACLWGRFIDCVLIPLVKDSGAKVYDLLFQRGQSFSSLELNMDEFLSDIPEELVVPFRKIILEFFDPEDDATRKFILMYLEAYFVVASTGLSYKASQMIQGLREKKLELLIFVDTNFVFSILGLHSNPLNEAASDLMELVKEVTKESDYFDIKFVIHPMTLVEAQRAIKKRKVELGNIIYPPNLAQAASRVGPISGIDSTFLLEVASSPDGINPFDHYSIYEIGLETILDDLGIMKFPEDSSFKFRTLPEVIEDTEKQIRFEQEKYRSKAKSENMIENDVVLWHIIRNMRDPNIRMPIEGKYWIVTVDYRYLQFDRFKMRTEGSQPICILPAQLIQVMRLFIPRSEEFEKIILKNLRFPMGFNNTSPEFEKVNARIFRRIVTLEGISKLPVDTIAKVFHDDMLRRFLSEQESPSESDEIEEIKNSLTRQIKVYEGTVSDYQSELKKEKAEKEKLRIEKTTLQEQIDFLVDEKEKDKNELLGEIQQLKEWKQQQEESEISRKLSIQTRREKLLFWCKTAITLLICFGIILVAWSALFPLFTMQQLGYLILSVLTALLLLISVRIVVNMGRRIASITEQKWFSWISQKTSILSIVLLVFSVIGILLVGLIQELFNRWIFSAMK